jgi:hypothetical protein
MMNSELSGKTVQINNTANGKSVSAVVADTCVRSFSFSSFPPDFVLTLSYLTIARMRLRIVGPLNSGPRE